MAITYTHVDVGGSAPIATPVFVDRVTYAIGGDNYATDGLAVDLPGELDELTGRTVLAVVPSADGYVGVYDYTNDKLKIFYGDYSESSDGALVEYPNATAITVTFTFIVISV